MITSKSNLSNSNRQCIQCKTQSSLQSNSYKNNGIKDTYSLTYPHTRKRGIHSGILSQPIPKKSFMYKKDIRPNLDLSKLSKKGCT